MKMKEVMIMSKNKDKKILKEEKTERANQIAEKSKNVKKTYERLEDGLFKVLRLFSTALDKFLFNKKIKKNNIKNNGPTTRHSISKWSISTI